MESNLTDELAVLKNNRREKTFCVIPQPSLTAPLFDGRGRPQSSTPAEPQKFFVSFRTGDAAMPRIEAHVMATTREKAYSKLLFALCYPNILSPEVD